MKIGEHSGKYVTYRANANNQYTGYVFETITNEVYVLFISDEKHAHFHSAISYFLVKHPDLWSNAYKHRCCWVKPKDYQPVKKIIL